MALLNPHFDLPFRLTGGAAQVEQDSYEDIANCVECIVRTPYGFRDDAPEFGFPVDAFEMQPIDVADVQAVVESQEPRASILISEHPDKYDVLIDNLRIEVL